MKAFSVGPGQAGFRIDVAVAQKYPAYSRSALLGLFELEKVHINGQAAKAGYKLKPKDKVKIDDSLLNAKTAKIDLPILYEDENVIVIDKPAGVLTHSKGGLNLEPTVASFINPKIDKQLTGNRAGIVHRLDRATSGVIITAKTPAALKYLQKQFSTRKVKKLYIALTAGKIEPAEAIIDAPIVRNPKKPQTFHVKSSGKSAITQYKVIRIIDRHGQALSSVELQPHTGRTHQLRVHLAYIGHPIVGDIVYGQSNGAMMLHAKTLELTLPGGQRQIFTSELPKVFKEALGDK